ncbi:MAG TPA: pentapeptide repeat-containing protein [Desertimonas sp.]|nr:pentapeptide repeat-containing protein [Desertimonas sp.]
MPEEFFERQLAGARFEHVDLTDAVFEQVRFAGARFHDVDLSGVRIRGAYVRDVHIGGDVESLRVNGVTSVR